MFDKKKYWERRRNTELVSPGPGQKKVRVFKPLRGQGDDTIPSKIIKEMPASFRAQKRHMKIKVKKERPMPVKGSGPSGSHRQRDKQRNYAKEL